jgi:hypothetical protein
VRLLPGAKGRRLGRDLGSRELGAFAEDPASLFLDRDSVTLGLQSQALGDDDVEVRMMIAATPHV